MSIQSKEVCDLICNENRQGAIEFIGTEIYSRVNGAQEVISNADIAELFKAFDGLLNELVEIDDSGYEIMIRDALLINAANMKSVLEKAKAFEERNNEQVIGR